MCFLFIDPQNEIGPSISFSVVLRSFVLLVYIVVLVLVFYFCPSSVRVVATFPGTVLFPLLYSMGFVHTELWLELFIPINCSTCFRLFLRPSSGAQNCTYSVRYCQTNTAACCYRGWDGTHEFHLIHDSSIGLIIADAVCSVLCSWWWAEEPPETRRAIYRNK